MLLPSKIQPSQRESGEAMGAWYQVVKVIKGHRYLYRQRTWREGKKVRTESHYIGPADGEVPANAWTEEV